MKIFTASATLCVTLSLLARAADDPKPAAPAAPAAPATPAAKPAPAPDADASAPRILKLETPLTPVVPTNPAPLLIPAQPGTPPLAITAPGKKEDTGPALQLEQLPAPLAPGVYIASPYAGIVVVPGPMDEAMVKQVGKGSSKMPTRAPELKLTPKTK